MTEKEFNDIISWLYLNDGRYSDKLEWRLAFAKFLANLKGGD